MASLRPLQRLG
jgi:hypothetical protein